METNQILLNSSLIARVLGGVALLLIMASIGGQLIVYLTGHDVVYGLIWLFNLNGEKNIPTAFATFLLLFSALLLAVIAILERKKTGTPVFHWAILSSGFLFMAIDEAWSFHELLIRPVHGLMGGDTFGIFYFAWVIPAIAFILVLAPLFFRFLLRLPAKTRFTFLMAAILYIGGAIGVELFEGRYAELHGTRNLTYNVFITVEESLELGGVILFIWGLLVYIADNHKEVRLRFE